MDMSVIGSLVSGGRLKRLEEQRPLEAGERIHAADVHLKSAAILRHSAPNDSFRLIFDAARMIAEGALLTVGLRASSAGGDEAIARAATAIFEEEFRDFDWIRRRRNEMRYNSLRRGQVRTQELDDAMRSTLAMRSSLERIVVDAPITDQSISGIAATATEEFS